MDIKKSDPEYCERVQYFIQNDVVTDERVQLEDETRYLAVLSALMGSQSKEMFELVLEQAMKHKGNPIVYREMVYQATDYLGLGRAYPFVLIMNQVFEKCGVSLPLEDMSTTTIENRLEIGVATQVTLFGKQMKEAYKQSFISEALAKNCFGDYYTRKGLTLSQREMVTFCLLIGQGGCDPQATSHAQANMNMGNDEEFLIKVVNNCMPYIGYPRSLNALTCIQNAKKL